MASLITLLSFGTSDLIDAVPGHVTGPGALRRASPDQRPAKAGPALRCYDGFTLVLPHQNEQEHTLVAIG